MLQLTTIASCAEVVEKSTIRRLREGAAVRRTVQGPELAGSQSALRAGVLPPEAHYRFWISRTTAARPLGRLGSSIARPSPTLACEDP